MITGMEVVVTGTADASGNIVTPPGSVTVPAPSPAPSLLNVRIVDSDGDPVLAFGGTLTHETTYDDSGAPLSVVATIPVAGTNDTETGTGAALLAKFPAGDGYGEIFANVIVQAGQAGGFQANTRVTMYTAICNGDMDPSTLYNTAQVADVLLVAGATSQVILDQVLPIYGGAGTSTDLKALIYGQTSTAVLVNDITVTIDIQPIQSTRYYVA